MFCFLTWDISVVLIGTNPLSLLFERLLKVGHEEHISVLDPWLDETNPEVCVASPEVCVDSRDKGIELPLESIST